MAEASDWLGQVVFVGWLVYAAINSEAAGAFAYSSAWNAALAIVAGSLPRWRPRL